MKFIVSFFMLVALSFADATIEVIKKADVLPTIAIEDSSKEYSETYKVKFFKSLIADLNVISLFNVDRHHRFSDYDSNTVLLDNRNMDYVLKYNLSSGDGNSLYVKVKLLYKDAEVFSKNYKIGRDDIYMFISHSIAYDINEFMGAPSVEWMKRKVIFSRIVSPRKSEIVIADYTLAYQHVVVKGGFNVFPKWADKK
ncbi:MAG: hypothetical protein JXQ66_03705, partial [Campylobacterales bacterium]|nr:hypothetical protein [Campylobacterales bacterium]